MRYPGSGFPVTACSWSDSHPRRSRRGCTSFPRTTASLRESVRGFQVVVRRKSCTWLSCLAFRVESWGGTAVEPGWYCARRWCALGGKGQSLRRDLPEMRLLDRIESAAVLDRNMGI